MRIHRIGQTKDVKVKRFIVKVRKNTIFTWSLFSMNNKYAGCQRMKLGS